VTDYKGIKIQTDLASLSSGNRYSKNDISSGRPFICTRIRVVVALTQIIDSFVIFFRINGHNHMDLNNSNLSFLTSKHM